MTKKLKVATVFSGIGAFEFALRRLSIEHDLLFACDNGEREITYNRDEELSTIKKLKSPEEKCRYVETLYQKATRKTNFVKKTYLANYPALPNDRFYEDISLLDGTDFKYKVDILVGGSPCQSFSSVGFQHGLEDARGTLFYEFARLVQEIKPKVFIYENVRNLMNHDGGNTWKIISSIFNTLGYSYSFDILNSSDYGIPQTRRRLFVVGFLEDPKCFKMPPKKAALKYKMKDFAINFCREGCFTYSAKSGDLVIKKEQGFPDPKYTLTPCLYKYVMKSGTKTWYQKPEINLDVARTILKTMGNRHRAGVDNYLSFDGTDNLGSVRMLTEREALRLMGFTDEFAIVVSRAQTYKQAGNSIVVDVMMAIIKGILETGIFEEKNHENA